MWNTYPVYLKRPISRAEVENLAMTPHRLIELLLILPNITLQQLFLALHIPCMTVPDQDQVASLLFQAGEKKIYSDRQGAQTIADLLCALAALTQNESHRAQGLRLKTMAARQIIS